MDMLMADIGNIAAKDGDEVIIFNGNPTLEEFQNTVKQYLTKF
jgi:alanine racemase